MLDSPSGTVGPNESFVMFSHGHRKRSNKGGNQELVKAGTCGEHGGGEGAQLKEDTVFPNPVGMTSGNEWEIKTEGVHDFLFIRFIFIFFIWVLCLCAWLYTTCIPVRIEEAGGFL